MKSLNEMDLEDWEFLPDEGFLEIHDDGGKKIYSRNYSKGKTKSVFHMNYFICPPKCEDHIILKKESEKIPYEVKIVTPVAAESIIKLGSDPDPVSQVFFKKMEENQFVDMKMDSPKSSSGGRGISHQIEGADLQFEESNEVKTDLDELDLINLDETGKGGSNIWKWSLSGVAAICSFGVAVCIMVLNKQSKKNQFRMHNNEKRMKKVVHHATKLNEAISALRGVPLTRAHITIGGYYDATETAAAI